MFNFFSSSFMASATFKTPPHAWNSSLWRHILIEANISTNSHVGFWLGNYNVKGAFGLPWCTRDRNDISVMWNIGSDGFLVINLIANIMCRFTQSASFWRLLEYILWRYILVHPWITKFKGRIEWIERNSWTSEVMGFKFSFYFFGRGRHWVSHFSLMG